MLIVNEFNLLIPDGILNGPALLPPKLKFEEADDVIPPDPNIGDPLIVSEFAPNAKLSSLISSCPLTVSELPVVNTTGFALILFIVRLFNEVTEEGKAKGPALLPPKTILEVESVVNDPEPTLIGFPNKESVLFPTISAPVVSVNVPLIDLLSFNDTPALLLTVKLLMLCV